ncbi:hypothetical protein AVEN_274014-1 [Araneus ventricosus]|uniref:Uncharacterized protein n=1 Tax=Araneus ventricosus TaxID=182803 RepID=A0A4Y2UIL6_ARAVE|nr:hypothetical protein AVEN_274014-1 [Araneus ventricosus]
MSNLLLPTALWNVNDERHRTNNAVEGWNSKLNRMIGRQQPNVKILVKCLKDEANNISHVIRSRELDEFGVKRKKCVQLDQGLENIMKDFEIFEKVSHGIKSRCKDRLERNKLCYNNPSKIINKIKSLKKDKDLVYQVCNYLNRQSRRQCFASPKPGLKV